VNGAGYRVLGFVVWRGSRWYVRRTYGHLIPSRRVRTAGIVVLAVGALVLAGRRDSLVPGGQREP
jgi:hypothetical protein